jgi:hypothetical protein
MGLVVFRPARILHPLPEALELGLGFFGVAELSLRHGEEGEVSRDRAAVGGHAPRGQSLQLVLDERQQLFRGGPIAFAHRLQNVCDVVWHRTTLKLSQHGF